MKTLTILCFTLMLLGGCAKQTEYHVAWRNSGTNDIRNVTIPLGDYGRGQSVIVAGTTKTHLFVNQPFPDSVVVSWEDNEHVSHCSSIPLPQSLLMRVKGHTLVFTIDETNATVNVEE
jgi:hypothetical protein